MGGTAKQLKNTTFEIQKGVSLIHVVELEQETYNPSKNMAYFVISDIFQDIVLIKSSCFWKMKANLASAGLAFFLVDKVTPACVLLHTDYHYLQDFVSETFGA